MVRCFPQTKPKLKPIKNKPTIKQYIQTQACDSSGYDNDEEEDVMNSSDRRFIVDSQYYSQSQSDVPDGISLYRQVDLRSRHKNYYDNPLHKEYSYSDYSYSSGSCSFSDIE